MSNVLSKNKREQVLALGRLGWSLRRIEEATGVRRETAGAYLKAARIVVRGPGRSRREGPGKPAIADEVSTDSEAAAKPAIEVSTDSASSPAPGEAPPSSSPRPGRSPQASACEPYREIIELWIGRRRNAMAIYQDLVTEHGFGARYASVMRYVRKLRGERTPEPCGVILTDPGHEGQVDYGDGPMVRDAESGKYRRVRLFLLTLGFSRKSVRLLTPRSSSRIWCELHEQAFRRLGRAPRIVVLDNLGEGVLRPDIYDPALNPLYRDVLKHYGVVAVPCRVADPDRKGKVESGIGHTQRTPLRGMRFESLTEAQAYLDRWDARWADTRIHGTTKRQVAAMFSEEHPFLLPLPVEPFRYYEYGERTVHLDGHVEIDGAYYEAPPGRIGTRLPVQWDERHVRLIDPRTGQLLREHSRLPPGRYTPRSQGESRRTPRTTVELLARAASAGKHIGLLCSEIHRRDGEIGVRRILGVLSLARRHGGATVEQACAAALEVGVPTYRFLRRYLERQLAPRLSLRQVDPLIRELTEYRNIIERMTKEDGK
jgi:transposase